MRDRLSMLLILGMSLPFMGKPVHVDDANFLVLARHAANNPWTPHEVLINWQGTTEPAFQVLSNPPGIAWWLAPVSHSSVFFMHLWMLPWLLLAGWGAARLGAAVAERSSAAIILLCGAPISVFATQALTPDLPLLGLTLAGMGGLMGGRKAHRWRYALLLGTTVLFRYSGLALIPVVVLLGKNRSEGIRLGGLALIPMVLLGIHDLLAYEQIHLVSMMGFQSVSNTLPDMGHKAVASIAALGGAAVLPILCWQKPARSITGAAIGAGIGCTAAAWTGQDGVAAISTVVFSAAGVATLAGAARNRDATDRVLIAWLGIGLLFLLTLRFTASRYWIPFFAPALLLALRAASPKWVRIACLTTPLLSVLLAIDDMDLARAQEEAAVRAQEVGPGYIGGHWGFQHHLEAAGWTPIEDDQTLPKNRWMAQSSNAWPQSPSNSCWQNTRVIPLADPRPGLRVLTRTGGANFHGHMLAGDPPIAVFAPWSIGDDPMDVLTLQQACP
jgi:hypothetical protein